jgi:hypothetical protein
MLKVLSPYVAKINNTIENSLFAMVKIKVTLVLI